MLDGIRCQETVGRGAFRNNHGNLTCSLVNQDSYGKTRLDELPNIAIENGNL
jgi:hypothetical protein